MAASLPGADLGGPGTKVRFGCAPCKGDVFQWVQGPPGNSLQPEAAGAVMEATKWLKPSECGLRIGSRASVQAATRVNQGYRIWILPNWARRRVRKVSSHAARMRFPFMDPLEPSSLARLRARRRSRAMFCGP